MPVERDGQTPKEPLARSDAAKGVVKVLLDFVADIPSTTEPRATDATTRARAIAAGASLKASALSGALALPTGPAGVITILPDLVGVWKIQAQMVADIAGAFGKTAFLTREQMLYCLFKHAAAQVVRDLVVRVGERYLVRRPTVRILQGVASKIGVVLSRRVIAKSVARFLPAVGAVGVAAYAYYDTGQVAATAIDVFGGEIELEAGSE